MQFPSKLSSSTRKAILALIAGATLVPVVLAAGRIVPGGFDGTLAGAPATQWLILATFAVLIAVSLLAAGLD